MRKILSPILLLIAAAASGAAVFAIHDIESAGSPIGRPAVTRQFSPNGDGRVDEASIRLKIERPHHVTISVRAGSKTIATILDADRAAGTVRARWDGRDGDGAPAAESDYQFVVRLDTGLEYELPARVRLDTTPPGVDSATLDGTAVRREGKARIVVVGVRDAVDHFVTSGGTPLKTIAKRRPESLRAARSFVNFLIVAQTTDQTTVDSIRLVLVDAAGNRAVVAPTISQSTQSLRMVPE